ncbi:MAG: C25 family cysteine peptidase, partial [Candidatus Krumholzibacteriia bacterium]
MKRLLLASMFCAAFVSPAFAGLPRVVSTSAGSVTVEFTIPDPSVMPIEAEGSERLSRIFVQGFFSLDVEGSPILPARRFFFAVGAYENVRLDVLEEESFFMGGVLPAVALEKGTLGDEHAALAKVPSLAEQRFVRLSGVEKVRGTYCAFVDVYPVLFDPAARGLSCARRLVVRLSFPPGEPGRAGGRGEFLAGDLFVNAEQAASWSRLPATTAGAARTPFEFALSSSWVKIGVKEKGIYIVTYNDLLSAGANPALIDPATLRLFSGGPYPEPDSLSRGGSYRDEYHFTEHAILYRGQGGGSLQPTDTVFFYGLPAAGWANDADPSASPRQYVKHPYDSTNVYWLTWGGDFAGAPRRIDERDVAPLYSAGDTLITWYEERIRSEKDLYYDPIYVDDRWYWNFLKMNGSTSYFQNEFFTTDVADASGVMETKAYGPYNNARYRNTATYLVNGVIAGTISWIVPYGYNPSNMRILEAAVSNIVEGRNVFGVSKPVDNEMYVFWYEIFYHRFLRASQGSLHFGVPERSRRARYELGGFPTGGKLLFDVTFDENPVLCTGWQSVSGGLVYEDSLQARPRRYAAVSRTAFRKGALSFASVPSLRDESACPDMVILYNTDFRDAALTLKAHRAQVFPGVGSPVVRAVDIEDVYNNFSGGHKDPVAIRNYLKFLYDRGACGGAGDPVLKYVLLLGNGTYDTRDLLGQKNDFVPLYINVRYPNEPEGIEDEDFFVKLDGGIDRAPDLGIGRMSVLTSQEANAWVRRIVDYEARPERGAWRNKIILVADDEFSTYRQDDFEFLISTEELAGRSGPFPTPLDVEKVYLHVYPFAGDVKPAARKDLLQRWSDGALAINYNGHGSPLQMADERVMVNSDIYSLTNGMRRPLLLSFSCSVGDLDSPYHRSMAQNMTTYDEGGAIGTIAAAAPTYLYPNKLLNETIYESLFTSKDSTGTRPLGYALQLAKYAIVAHEGYESNNTKYLLLGDPAMRLAAPSYRVEHETAGIDTMRTGEKYGVAGSVTADGRVLSSFNGTADVIVQEAEHKIRELFVSGGVPILLDYVLPGKELFRGAVDVAAGRFSVEFVVPRRCHTGPNARIRSYVSSSGIDGVGACDTLRILQAEAPRPDL